MLIKKIKKLNLKNSQSKGKKIKTVKNLKPNNKSFFKDINLKVPQWVVFFLIKPNPKMLATLSNNYSFSEHISTKKDYQIKTN